MMKILNDKEIKFIAETGWTPSLYEGNYNPELLKDTPYAGINAEEAGKMYEINLADKYGVDVHVIYDKTCSDL